MNRAIRVMAWAALGSSLLLLRPGGDAAAQAQPNDPDLSAAKANPLVITRGGRYSGNWLSLDPKVPAVTIQTREPVVIENSVLRGRGDLIRGFWVNLKVVNSKGYGLNPKADGQHPGRFVSVEDVVRLEVENNSVVGTSGIYVNLFRGRRGDGPTIRIVGNRIRNVDGRKVNAAGKLTGERYYVQAVQLAKLRQVPNVEVAWNEIINEPGKSGVEENINVYESSGTSESPIIVHNNYIQGAYALRLDKDERYSGGGIMIGDGLQDPENVGSHVRVYRNQVISTSNQGIAISGGNNQRVFENRILSSGRLPDNSLILSNNVGAFVWDNQSASKRKPSTFYSNALYDNVVGWVRVDENKKVHSNNLWLPSCTKEVGSNCFNNRPWPVPVTLEAERQEFQLWLQKLKQAKRTIGASQE